MRVVVIGAGIGGLALAQGLRRAGVDVAVHDRDPEVSATGGYRLHLDARTCAALRRLLPPELHLAVLASAAHPRTFRQFALLDHRLRPLVVAPQPRGEDALLIGRVPLRRLLARGLDVRFGAEFTGHERQPDGTVLARFADGSTDRGDLLVGADGVGSRVATALAGRPTSRPLGVTGVAGRTPLTPAVRALLPPVLLDGPGLALGPGAIAFLSVHDPGSGAAADAPGAVLERGDLVWGLNLPTDRVPPGPDPAGRIAAGWPDPLRALVAAADPAATAVFRFHAADPDADLTPWPSGPVTALGDAVHAMPPTGGQAAATAIRDADLLVRELAGGGPPVVAVHAYERAMPAHAVDAVRESLAPLRWMRPLGVPGAHRAAAAALRVAALPGRLRAAAG